MTTKSNNTLKFIKRNIQTNIHKIKETVYKTYVRPLLDYSATVWDPWQKKYINQIEMVQHRAVRYIFNDYNFTSSVSSMLNQLALPTLEKRRKNASEYVLQDYNHGLVRIKFPDYIKPTLRNRFSIPYSRIDAHRHSFFPRTARLWNDLPPPPPPPLDQLSSPGNEQYLHLSFHSTNHPSLSSSSSFTHNIIYHIKLLIVPVSQYKTITNCSTKLVEIPNFYVLSSYQYIFTRYILIILTKN